MNEGKNQEAAIDCTTSEGFRIYSNPATCVHVHVGTRGGEKVNTHSVATVLFPRLILTSTTLLLLGDILCVCVCV